MDSIDPVLCVGYQSGIVNALRATERQAIVLLPEGTARPTAPEVTGCFEVDLHGAESDLEQAARDLLDGRQPAAIMAMAERTVLGASRLRECFGLPGNPPDVALRCADKVEMKRAMDAAGVPVAAWREVNADTDASELVDELGLPLVLKPRRDSGGRGQSKFITIAELSEALRELSSSGGFSESYGWLAEAWIEGVESSLEGFVHNSEPVFMNPTEYFVPRHANILPADLADAALGERRKFMTRALRAAGVERGITHMEVFETKQGLVFGELAIRAPGGRLMTLLRRAWGFNPWEASLRLELGEAFPFPMTPRRTAGVWILHPGSGTVEAIEGLEAACAVPGIRSIRLKVDVGDTIQQRLGTGQDIGSIFAEGGNRDVTAAALSEAHECLEVRLG